MATDNQRLYGIAAAACLLSVVLTIAAWTSLGGIVILPGKLGILGRARIICMQPWEWSLPFILSAAAAMVMVPVVLAVGDLIKNSPAGSRLAVAHGLIGVALSSVSMFMQATVARKAALEMILKYDDRSKAAFLAQTTQWNIEYEFSSAYGLNLLAQTFLAVMFLGLGLGWIRDTGLKKVTALICLLAAAAQAVGLAGYAADQETILAGAMIFDILTPVILTFLLISLLRAARGI